MELIKRLSKSRAGVALLTLGAATAIFLAGTRAGEFIAFVTGATE
ncbi:hypothetical protein [Novosphingobium sp. CF614]|nr:hypothetical protein [Novosphingobium sp. CF614]